MPMPAPRPNEVHPRADRGFVEFSRDYRHSAGGEQLQTNGSGKDGVVISTKGFAREGISASVKLPACMEEVRWSANQRGRRGP